MKTYQFKGKEYVESGEVRLPRIGEVYLHFNGCLTVLATVPNSTNIENDEGKRKILTPKEQKMEAQDEYSIPVLIKANANSGWTRYHKLMAAVLGRVIMCRKPPGMVCPEGPANARDYGFEGAIPNWVSSDIIEYPTQAQVEAEQAKLKAKADPLPAPVREALQAADLGCRREGVEKLIQAIYANPPKAHP